ncbi:hypothetical protein V6N12_044187 [Hibiscus sabdariffa]|uniref:Uncharacterized protein n=1 Tax=Hibiscus sabdariffa TaxID=183260 RepID=A0ABR2DGI7_9ROSI
MVPLLALPFHLFTIPATMPLGNESVRDNVSWIVGNGVDVNVWDDTWVPSLGPLRPWLRSSSPVVACLNFDDLLHDRQWDVSRLADLLLPEAIPFIIGIMPPFGAACDVLSWKSTLVRNFSVASAYARLLEPMWEAIEPKWSWFLATAQPRGLVSSPHCCDSYGKPRNDFVFTNTCLPLVEVYKIGFAWANYFAEANVAGLSHTASMVVYHQWKPPAPGWVCLNTDASISPTTGLGTIGSVFRSSFGAWIRGYHKCVGEINMVADCLFKLPSPPQFRLLVTDDIPKPARPLLDWDRKGPPYSRHSSRVT